MKVLVYSLRLWAVVLFLAADLRAAASQERLILGEHLQFISLGGYCGPAQYLNEIGFRTAAFPLDWVFTWDIDGLVQCLEEDFLFFTDESCFQGTQINHRYHMRFFHDLPENPCSEQFPHLKAKYDRRIERFRSLRDFKGKVFFIRTWWARLAEWNKGDFSQNTTWSQKLKKALDHYFPTLDFVLIIYGYEDLNIPKMEEIEGVVEIRIQRDAFSFQEQLGEYLGTLEEFKHFRNGSE